MSWTPTNGENVASTRLAMTDEGFMTEALGEADVALSLMKEALALLDAPEAAQAAHHLRQAIKAATELSEATPQLPNAETVRPSA